MRKTARETLFKYVFSAQFSGWNDELKRGLYKFDKLTKEDINYCDDVLEKIIANDEKIGNVLDEVSTGFPQSNIFPADRALLYIGIAEILYRDDIPAPVTINETANLASKYSSDKSADFISGVLGGVIKKYV